MKYQKDDATIERDFGVRAISKDVEEYALVTLTGWTLETIRALDPVDRDRMLGVDRAMRRLRAQALKDQA